MPALVGEGIAGPHPGDDLQLLLEQVDPSRRRRKVEAVGGVLGFEPACAEAEFGTAAAHVVERRDQIGIGRVIIYRAHNYHETGRFDCAIDGSGSASM